MAPEGLLWASGHWGQSVLVLPRRDLVIVRTADDREEFPVGSFLRAALAAFAGRGPMMRWFAGIVLLGLVLLAVFVATNWNHLFAFPGILPGFTAKEYCSCRFVIGQTDGYCRGYVKEFLPVSELLVDESGYRVTARALLTTRSAHRLARRESCRLE